MASAMKPYRQLQAAFLRKMMLISSCIFSHFQYFLIFYLEILKLALTLLSTLVNAFFIKRRLFLFSSAEIEEVSELACGFRGHARRQVKVWKDVENVKMLSVFMVCF